MARPFRGVINVDVTQSVPDWEPYTQPIAPGVCRACFISCSTMSGIRPWPRSEG
jgi:hypothetical protein